MPLVTKNRLASAASPYLRQHEANPVDWWPWCDEALARAKVEDRPILLSIGYSACHWCHVMAHECFEDEAIAAQMSRSFVCIKVDREERPDLDQIYQLAVQVMGRSGGWPLTAFLTPDLRPFFAGTYFPPRDRHGLPGFPKVLDAVLAAYRGERGDIEAQAAELAAAMAEATRLAPRDDGEPAPHDPRDVLAALPAVGEGGLLDRAARGLGRRFDDVHGGFGHRPKFPDALSLGVLLRRSVEAPRDAVCEARVKRALTAMRAGGIWDQLGGGFHRYSTDAEWLVPHFEKMLYDNALLARLYADASRAYGEPRFAETARATLRYVAREMIAVDGAFFSTQDADSLPPGAPSGAHAEEGAFFVWTQAQLVDALPGDEEAVRVAIRAFGVTENGNFESSGASVLHEAAPIDLVATELGLTVDVTRAALSRAIRGLRAARSQRPWPNRDEKVLAAWNGLMIGACAEVAMATGDSAALAMAERAFEAIEARLIRIDAQGEARVARTSPPPGREAPLPSVGGFLDDYAFLAGASLDLYEATARPRYVDVARAIVRGAVARFADDAPGDGVRDGGFFFAPSDGEALLHRAKEPFDPVTPSGNAVLAEVLLRLSALDGDATHEARAAAALASAARAALDNPIGLSQSVIALDRLVQGAFSVVIVGPRDDLRTQALLEAARRAWIPRRVIAFIDPREPATRHACPALAEGKESRDEPAAYVCRARTCSPPVVDAGALARALSLRGDG